MQELEGQRGEGAYFREDTVYTWILLFLQADYERRLLQLCYKCTADISQFRELLRQGVDINIYDEVGIQINTVVCPAHYMQMIMWSLYRAHAQGVKQSVYLSVVIIVVGTKISRFCAPGI